MELRFQTKQIPTGWVVEVEAPDGQREQLIGVYVSEESANDWIKKNGKNWRPALRQIRAL